MDTYPHAKGKALLVLAVLLLLLFLNSCSHTEQGADPALLYSPTYTELVTSPLSLQSNATGYGREYEVLGTEQFTTSNRGPAHGFELGPAGSFPAERGDTWITGTHPGGQMYIAFYETNPASLHLRPNGRYEVSYNYRSWKLHGRDLKQSSIHKPGQTEMTGLNKASISMNRREAPGEPALPLP